MNRNGNATQTLQLVHCTQDMYKSKYTILSLVLSHYHGTAKAC